MYNADAVGLGCYPMQYGFESISNEMTDKSIL